MRWLGFFAMSMVLAAPVWAADPADVRAASPKRAVATAKPDEAATARPGARWDLDTVPKLDLSDSQRNALADKKRDEVIRRLEQIAQRTESKSAQKAELLFQLSEFYWEKSRHLFQAEMERQDADAAAAVDHAGSDRYRQQTVKLYERLLADYPKYPRRDEILFSLAYNLAEAGKEKESNARYQELIASFPASRFVGDAHIQLGNAYFETNQLAAARKHYEQALKANVPKVYSYALYKLAWCDYNTGDLDQALDKLKKVVAFAETRGKDMVDLKNEALNDLVVVFVRLERAKEGIDYFAHRAPKDRQNALLARLANALSDIGQHQSAIQVYRLLIDRDPASPKAPEYQQALVKAYEGLRMRDQVRIEVAKLAERYRPGGDWWKKNENDAPALRNAFEVGEEAVRTVVTEYHQEAQRTRQVETYRLARDIYRQYLAAYASSDRAEWISDYAFNMRFFAAEILWTLEDWEASAAEYERVVAQKIPDRKTAKEVSQERYRQVAGYDAILAYDKLLQIERGELKRAVFRDGEKLDENKSKGAVSTSVERRSATAPSQELTRSEARLVAACDAYVKRFAGQPDEIDIRYRAAMAFYTRNRFAEATQRFGEIIDRWPEHRRAQEAADLSLNVLESQGKWADLYTVAKKLSGNAKLMKSDAEFAQRVARITEGSRYKWIAESVLGQEKNSDKAAEEFAKFASEFPKSPHAPKALAYAMVIARDRGDVAKARALSERLLAEYPQSPLELKTRYVLSDLHEQVADFEKTAAADEAFVAAFDRQRAAKLALESEEAAERAKLMQEAEAWVPEAMLNAALWWDGTGKTDRALAAYRAYLGRFPQAKEAPEALWAMAALQERSEHLSEADRTLERLVEENAKTLPAIRMLEARGKRLRLLTRLKNPHADRVREEILIGFPKLPAETRQDVRALNVYAYARFLKMEPRWVEYRKLRLDRARNLKRDLAAKQGRLKDLEKGYLEVLEVGAGEQGVAALTRIGLAYADLAEAIMTSAVPGGLDEEQRDLYREELVKLSAPLEDKAVEVLEQGLSKAYELALYTPFVIEAQEQIEKYRPGRYEKPRRARLNASVYLGAAPPAAAAVPAQPAAGRPSPNGAEARRDG